MSDAKLDWYRVADLDELPEGRVKTVTLGTQSLCMTHHEPVFDDAAIDELGETYRPVLHLHLSHGLNAKQIATSVERDANVRV